MSLLLVGSRFYLYPEIKYMNDKLAYLLIQDYVAEENFFRL